MCIFYLGLCMIDSKREIISSELIKRNKCALNRGNLKKLRMSSFGEFKKRELFAGGEGATERTHRSEF